MCLKHIQIISKKGSILFFVILLTILLPAQVFALQSFNDPLLKSQWWLHPNTTYSTMATSAWRRTMGNENIVVAIIDTGIDYLHKDLAPNIWSNQGEIPKDNIDNDNNGFIDDYKGFDFLNNDSSPQDDMNHGTGIAGLIA